MRHARAVQGVHACSQSRSSKDCAGFAHQPYSRLILDHRTTDYHPQHSLTCLLTVHTSAWGLNCVLQDKPSRLS